MYCPFYVKTPAPVRCFLALGDGRWLGPSSAPCRSVPGFGVSTAQLHQPLSFIPCASTSGGEWTAQSHCLGGVGGTVPLGSLKCPRMRNHEARQRAIVLNLEGLPAQGRAASGGQPSRSVGQSPRLLQGQGSGRLGPSIPQAVLCPHWSLACWLAWGKPAAALAPSHHSPGGRAPGGLGAPDGGCAGSWPGCQPVCSYLSLVLRGGWVHLPPRPWPPLQRRGFQLTCGPRTSCGESD